MPDGAAFQGRCHLAASDGGDFDISFHPSDYVGGCGRHFDRIDGLDILAISSAV